MIFYILSLDFFRSRYRKCTKVSIKNLCCVVISSFVLLSLEHAAMFHFERDHYLPLSQAVFVAAAMSQCCDEKLSTSKKLCLTFLWSLVTGAAFAFLDVIIEEVFFFGWNKCVWTIVDCVIGLIIWACIKACSFEQRDYTPLSQEEKPVPITEFK